MAQQKLLISEEDVQACRSTYIDKKVLNGLIAEAQMIELNNCLGDALYFDFMKRIDQTADGKYAAYQTLLNGGVYTYQGIEYQFEGLNRMLCYYTLARVRNNPIQDTRFGAVLKTNDKSERPSDGALQGSIAELRGIAMSIEGRIKNFLERNITTYPLYNSSTKGQINNEGVSYFDPDGTNPFNTKSGNSNGRSIW